MLPYVLLSANPKFIGRLPKSGPGSELLKQVMGLLMIAAAVYFIGTGISALVTRPPDPPFTAYWWAVAALMATAGIWLAARTIVISARATHRWSAAVVGLVLIITAFATGLQMTVKWIYYTPERLERATAAGKTVVMVFTAEWCLNCKALEKTVLQDPEVVSTLRKSSITASTSSSTYSSPDLWAASSSVAVVKTT